ncbi:hypothetical protein [Paenibacillus sp. 2KB_22]|uniref:hypothetical protein n=1 Tax=Paenibacillus sp. 2KB_22 TaxID=3232978 RepID=UPI003F9E814B
MLNPTGQMSRDSNRITTLVEVGQIDLEPKHLIKNNRYTKVTSNGTKVPVVNW